MILTAIARALGQLGDRPFRGVLLASLGLTLALLVALYVAAALAVQWLMPASVTLPWFGEVTFFDELLSGLAVLGLMLASSFLMVPVAGAFTSLFADRIAAAVETRHYPGLPPARAVPLAEAAVDGLRFLLVFLVANGLALVVYLLAAPLAPFAFWAVNGYLLGVEYMQTVALRHMSEREARAFRRRHMATVWAAGALMAVPLTVPVVNLLVPVVGVAAFTHIFHTLRARA